MASAPYTQGLHEIGDGLYAYLQPDGGWGWSNAGLVVDGDASLLIDTLFDLKLAAAMLDRLLHRSVVFNIDGESYRMRAHRARTERLSRRAGRPSDCSTSSTCLVVVSTVSGFRLMESMPIRTRYSAISG